MMTMRSRLKLARAGLLSIIDDGYTFDLACARRRCDWPAQRSMDEHIISRRRTGLLEMRVVRSGGLELAWLNILGKVLDSQQQTNDLHPIALVR